MVSPLEVALQFLEDFGFFRVVLPFLLVFTLVFAVLQKTKILGSKEGENVVANKNVDSMVAFSIALFVVAAGNVVEVIQTSLPMIMIVLVLLISFMLLVGTLIGAGEYKLSDGYMLYGFIIFILISVVLIFLGSIKDVSGDTWLRIGWDYVLANWVQGPLVSGVIFAVVLIIVILFITGAFGGSSGDNGRGSSD